MNVSRLMEDLVSSIQSQPDKVQQNYFDSSLALTCNLITNAIAGDLSDQNLIVFLDHDFIKLLLSKRFEVSSMGRNIPVLAQGLYSLRANRSSENNGEVINQCLLDFYRAALPIGEWDNLLVDSDKENFTAENLIRKIRPDLTEIVFEEPERLAWLIKNGFQELPLYRSKLRHYFSNALGYKNFQLQSGNIGYFFHQISSSTPPMAQDLFFDEMDFKRWICVKGAVLIYKRKPFESRLHDTRWLRKSTTLAIRKSMMGKSEKATISLGCLDGIGDFTITVHSTSLNQNEILTFQNVSAILCDLKIQRWVDTVRISIESSGSYVAELEFS